MVEILEVENPVLQPLYGEQMLTIVTHHNALDQNYFLELQMNCT